MARRARLNLTGALAYLQTSRLQHLDGLFFAITEKMQELEVQPSKRAHQTVDAVNGQPSGNVRGLLQFVEGATPDDAENLKTLEAVISTRFRNAGYSPKPTQIEAPVETPAE